MAKRQRANTQADIVLAWLLYDLTVKDAAKLFEVSPSTVRRWVKDGIPAGREQGITERYGMKSAREAIDMAMADAQFCSQKGMGGYPDMRIHANKDGSIDAQLTVYDIPRGMSAVTALSVFGECARALTNTFGTFVQVGLRWGGVAGKVPDSGDRRYRGLAEGSTFYYSAERLGSAFVHAIDIAKNVQAKGRRKKIETLFVRLHWNPAGVAPKEWGTKPVYRAYKRKDQK